MISYMIVTLKGFFERNLFERLIIYIFLSHLITKIVFELILGEGSFLQSQHQQWAFYGLLGLDYLISLKKVINIRITINPISLFALLLFMMIGHGLFIGILNHNPPFIILNDTVPLLMIALNILRMQSFEEIKKPIDFRFIFISTISITCAICFLGYPVGKASIGSIPLFYPLILTALIALRPFPKWALLAIPTLIFLTIDDTNRTILFFIVIVTAGYITINSISHPIRSVMVIVSAIVLLFVVGSILPEGSKTHQRIIGLTELDLSKRTGSIGERQAEQDAVALKLKKAGTTTEWVGAGFGGTYEVRFTHNYLTNYGHAHYAWVWFNLRFGKIGYIYMAVLLSALLYNGLRSFRRRTELGLFISFLCLLALIYSFTHVNSIFLLSGLHFFYLFKDNSKIRLSLK